MLKYTLVNILGSSNNLHFKELQLSIYVVLLSDLGISNLSLESNNFNMNSTIIAVFCNILHVGSII